MGSAVRLGSFQFYNEVVYREEGGRGMKVCGLYFPTACVCLHKFKSC